MSRSPEERREALAKLPPSSHPERARHGWIEVGRRVHDGRALSFELLPLGPWDGRPSEPTRAAIVEYGPRGGIRYLAVGDDDELRQKQWLIEKARDLIREFDPEGL